MPPERTAEERPPVDPGTAAATSDSAATGAQPPGAPEVPGTRTGTAFKTLVAGAVVLVLLLVFILENTERVNISYFGAGGHLPLGVALLIAAIGGALLVGIVGTARILQLRRHVRHQR
jgi:uncharacterized integral membrane protein